MGNSSSADSGRAQRTRTQSGPRPIVGRSQTRTQMIPDQFISLPQVTSALRRNGLESCNIVIGIDFTKSNEWSGKRTFGGHSLHCIDDPRSTNPYESVIDTIGRTLRDFDEDNVIPVYGFGDDLTGDHSVFTFARNGESGFPLEAIRSRYREIVPNVVMAGPTSFAPIIYEALSIINKTGGYHILVIIADGQVTRSVDIPPHAVSKNEKETIDAITYASNFPLSIVMVGVGDGPWESMIYFDNYLVNRRFDNFQFVEYSKIAAQFPSPQMREAQFALQALMEIPEQYQIIKEMGYLSRGPYRFAPDLPTVEVYPSPQPMPLNYNAPFGVFQPNSNTYPMARPVSQSTTQTTTFTASYNRTLDDSYDLFSSAERPSAPTFIDAPNRNAGRPQISRQVSHAELELQRIQEENLCCICEDRKKDTAFQCGHQTCGECAKLVTQCPTCRQDIQMRIKLFG